LWPGDAEVLGSVRLLALVLIGHRRCEFVRESLQLAAQDVHVARGVDRDGDAVALHAADFDEDVVADADAFSRPSAEY
jgi:hypothetical protein